MFSDFQSLFIRLLACINVTLFNKGCSTFIPSLQCKLEGSICNSTFVSYSGTLVLALDLAIPLFLLPVQTRSHWNGDSKIRHILCVLIVVCMHIYKACISQIFIFKKYILKMHCSYNRMQVLLKIQ